MPDLTGQDLWASIRGQDEAVGYLKTALAKETVHHAYLFTGPAGIGKRTTALVLASALNCTEGSGCGRCPECRKIAVGVHPDVQLVEPAGTVISIDQIREVKAGLSLKPGRGRVRVVIIDEAERLNEPATNALLKTLEEPPPGVVFVLVTELLDGLAPTVFSRCQMVRFRLVSEEEVVQTLSERVGLGEEEARLVSRITGGLFGKTLEWAQFPERLLRRERVLKLARDLPSFDLLRTVNEAENLAREVEELVERAKQKKASALKEEDQGTLGPGARRLIELRNRREVARLEEEIYLELFRVLGSFYRDLVAFSETGIPDHLINIDRVEAVREGARGGGATRGLRALAILEKAEELLELNVNRPLLIEWILMRLKELN